MGAPVVTGWTCWVCRLVFDHARPLVDHLIEDHREVMT